MKIVSWNVHRCIGTDGAYRPDRIAEVLSKLDADLIGLQEIDSSLKTTTGRDQLSYIASLLGMDAMMGPTLDRDYGAYGNALLSRHKLLSWDEYDLSYRKYEPRGALVAHYETKGTAVRVIATHLGLKYWERVAQIDRLLGSLVWGAPEVSILLGDFNEWFPWSGNNLRLEQSFLPCPRLKTFPSKWPRFSLDRIFVSGRRLGEVTYAVVNDPLARLASDHLPVQASFGFS